MWGQKTLKGPCGKSSLSNTPGGGKKVPGDKSVGGTGCGNTAMTTLKMRGERHEGKISCFNAEIGKEGGLQMCLKGTTKLGGKAEP